MIVLQAHLAFAALLGITFLCRPTTGASPTSFCKCTCFTNSTIIPLDAPTSSAPDAMFHSNLLSHRASKEDPLETSPSEDDSTEDDADKDKDTEEGVRKEYRAGNCNDCNRQFCLNYNLPICKGASMEDVFTTCFQRDSRKDETVVFIFIFATVGLLGWAAVRPWVGKWIDTARERGNYIPVSAGDH